jgi:MFS superfamily sulfate permease-like transporter
VIGVVALRVVFGLRAVAPAVPGALVLVDGGLLASWLLDLGDKGVALVGDVPRGLPSLAVPDVGLVVDHLGILTLASLALVMIGFSQTAGDGRTFTAKHHYQVDINQESVAQGMANAGAGLFQGMPVSTSLSASSLNEHSGARTGMASLTSGLTVLLTLLVLAPVFSDLPKAILGALIIEAVVTGMIELPEMRRLFRVQRFDFVVALTALVGVPLSLLWLVRVATRPAMRVLGREAGTQVFRDLSENPHDEQPAGIRGAAGGRWPVHSHLGRAGRPSSFARAGWHRCHNRRAQPGRCRRHRRPRCPQHGQPRRTDRRRRCATAAGQDQTRGALSPAARRVIDRVGEEHVHGNVTAPSRPRNAGDVAR